MYAAHKADNNPSAQPPNLLADLLPSWLVALRAEHKAAKTMTQYGDGIRLYLRWCDNTGTPRELTKANAQAFISSLFDNGAEANTVKARYGALRRFAMWLAREGELASDPLAGMIPPTLDTKVIHPLTDAELRDLFKVCQGKTFRDRRDEAIVRLMAETGLRAGECAALKLSDVDTLHGQATVHRGKGGKGRMVPFSPKTAQVIDRYVRMRRTHTLAGTDALWLGEKSKTFAYNALYRALVRRAKLAGIDNFHPHKLRHTAATRWLAAGGSEGGLMAMAGWSKRDMLDRYTAATASERAADEARKLGLGDL
jgi:site-specific recombinase XerD